MYANQKDKRFWVWLVGFIDGSETICCNSGPFRWCMIPTLNIITSRYVLMSMRSRIDIQYSKIDIYLSSLPEKRRYTAYHRAITVPDRMFGLFSAARPPRGDARLGEAGARVARARDSGGSHGDTVASVTSADTFACQTCAVTRPIKVCLETESVLAS